MTTYRVDDDGYPAEWKDLPDRERLIATWNEHPELRVMWADVDTSHTSRPVRTSWFGRLYRLLAR